MKRNSHSSAENVERPIQDKPKKKHVKTNSKETNKN